MERLTKIVYSITRKSEFCRSPFESYPLLLYEWIEKIKTTQNTSFNPKSLAQIFIATGWKKEPGPELDIVFGNNFGTNSETQRGN